MGQLVLLLPGEKTLAAGLLDACERLELRTAQYAQVLRIEHGQGEESVVADFHTVRKEQSLWKIIRQILVAMPTEQTADSEVVKAVGRSITEGAIIVGTVGSKSVLNIHDMKNLVVAGIIELANPSLLSDLEPPAMLSTRVVRFRVNREKLEGLGANHALRDTLHGLFLSVETTLAEAAA